MFSKIRVLPEKKLLQVLPIGSYCKIAQELAQYLQIIILAEMSTKNNERFSKIHSVYVLIGALWACHFNATIATSEIDALGNGGERCFEA